MLVAAYNGNARARRLGNLFFHGQDLRAAGEEAGKADVRGDEDLASDSKPGCVGIETESFTFQALEERRLGFIDALKENCPWVTRPETGSNTRARRTAWPQRLVTTSRPPRTWSGIYVTGGNPQVAAQTVASAGRSIVQA